MVARRIPVPKVRSSILLLLIEYFNYFLFNLININVLYIWGYLEIGNHGDGLVVKSSIPIRRPRVRFPVAVTFVLCWFAIFYILLKILKSPRLLTAKQTQSKAESKTTGACFVCFWCEFETNWKQKSQSKKQGTSGDRTRDLSHPKRESYL